MSTSGAGHDDRPDGASPRGRGPAGSRGRLRLGHTLAAAGLLGLLIAGSAIGAKGDTLREALRNGTATGETEIIGNIAASTASKGGFVTRQSNIATGANAGGAAIYGCRAPVASPESCLRASNLTGGEAFSFATKGDSAGSFEVGDASSAPFTTNGTGLVTNLNADKIDGKDASELGGGAPGPTGPAGADGPAGPDGPEGPSGVSGVEVVRSELEVPAGGTGSAVVECPAGQRATGGGVGAASVDARDRIVWNGPLDETGDPGLTVTGGAPVKWYGIYYNGVGGSPRTVYVWAICG